MLIEWTGRGPSLRPIRKRRGTRPPISAQYSNPASAGFFFDVRQLIVRAA
jgi:hypothetical protein